MTVRVKEEIWWWGGRREGGHARGGGGGSEWRDMVRERNGVGDIYI